MHPKTTHNKSFNDASSSIILFGQFFGQMPVHNISSASAYDLAFKWFAFRTFYSLTFLIILLLYIFCDIYNFLMNDEFHFSLGFSGELLNFFYMIFCNFYIFFITYRKRNISYCEFHQHGNIFSTCQKVETYYDILDHSGIRFLEIPLLQCSANFDVQNECGDWFRGIDDTEWVLESWDQ